MSITVDCAAWRVRLKGGRVLAHQIATGVGDDGRYGEAPPVTLRADAARGDDALLSLDLGHNGLEVLLADPCFARPALQEADAMLILGHLDLLGLWSVWLGCGVGHERLGMHGGDQAHRSTVLLMQKLRNPHPADVEEFLRPLC